MERNEIRREITLNWSHFSSEIHVDQVKKFFFHHQTNQIKKKKNTRKQTRHCGRRSSSSSSWSRGEVCQKMSWMLGWATGSSSRSRDAAASEATAAGYVDRMVSSTQPLTFDEKRRVILELKELAQIRETHEVIYIYVESEWIVVVGEINGPERRGYVEMSIK